MKSLSQVSTNENCRPLNVLTRSEDKSVLQYMTRAHLSTQTHILDRKYQILGQTVLILNALDPA